MAKTQIFENKEQFDAREDKSINGVSHEFAERHPNWAEMNESNTGCWDCWGCVDCVDCTNCNLCNDCINCSDCKNCTWCEDCDNCTDCYRCYRCKNCENCSGSRNCEHCDNCYYCDKGKNLSFVAQGKEFTPPKIPNIHQKVYAAASQENALDMAEWHTCNTTHCRAGWVVFLAGEDGKGLEAKTNTAFAAMVIYRASSDIRVSPSAFHVSDEEALRDMKRCAEEEIKNG